MATRRFVSASCGCSPTACRTEIARSTMPPRSPTWMPLVGRRLMPSKDRQATYRPFPFGRPRPIWSNWPATPRNSAADSRGPEPYRPRHVELQRVLQAVPLRLNELAECGQTPPSSAVRLNRPMTWRKDHIQLRISLKQPRPGFEQRSFLTLQRAARDHQPEIGGGRPQQPCRFGLLGGPYIELQISSHRNPRR